MLTQRVPKRARHQALTTEQTDQNYTRNGLERGWYINETGRWIVMPLARAALPDGSISVVLAEIATVDDELSALPGLTVEPGPVEVRVLEALSCDR